MAFTAKRSDKKQQVVFELRLPKEGSEEVDAYRFLVPRLSQLDALEAQKLRAKLVDDEHRDLTAGSAVLGSILDRLKPHGHEKSIHVVLREAEEAGFDLESILEEITRLASTDIATLRAENQEIVE